MPAIKYRGLSSTKSLILSDIVIGMAIDIKTNAATTVSHIGIERLKNFSLLIS
jgi:hypothetical protein